MKKEAEGTKRVLSVGKEAKSMLGGPQETLSPFAHEGWVDCDFDIAEAMLRYFIRKAHAGHRLARPRIIVGVQAGLLRWRESGQGVSRVSPVPGRCIYRGADGCAIGGWSSSDRAQGSMIVDMVAGTTEVALSHLGGLSTAFSVE